MEKSTAQAPQKIVQKCFIVKNDTVFYIKTKFSNVSKTFTELSYAKNWRHNMLRQPKLCRGTNKSTAWQQRFEAEALKIKKRTMELSLKRKHGFILRDFATQMEKYPQDVKVGKWQSNYIDIITNEERGPTSVFALLSCYMKI